MQDEQLLAIGTLAAGTAHELGTPLNTMKLLVDELLLQQSDGNDLKLLKQQIDQCRITLKQLQITANGSSSETYSSQPLFVYFNQLLERWQLMRPELNTSISYADSSIPAPELKFHPIIAQSILNLLNNAADASPELVDVNISWTKTEIAIHIKDRGKGFDKATIGRPFYPINLKGWG
ncbi:MAG: hypothetical protein P8I13_06470 [Porticoccaceae bacterium]|nr:hypothetical protein [Porticoccaceae bacterium]